jgi:hypothetical protein
MVDEAMPSLADSLSTVANATNSGFSTMASAIRF